MRQYLLRLDQLGPGRELALWVALSIGLYLLFAQLAWRLRKWETGFLAENIRWLDGWRFRRLAWQLLRLLFYVVIPYGLLVERRLLTGRSMGLVGPEPAGVLGWSEAGWLGGLGWVLLCGAAGVALLVGSWWELARRLEGEAIFYLHHRLPAWEILWDAVFLQLHWGFYRAAAVAWLGETELIWGVFLGLGLAGLEAAGDPGLYFDSHWPSLANGWVRLAAVAWFTAIGFLLTRNLWLCVLCHWGMTCAVNAMAGRLTRWSVDSISRAD
ncbi:MAG: hypothetical protein KAS81_00340 [Anaerolineales bacterium]|nr:hypothetical protein [Anaerolineales bacterium]